MIINNEDKKADLRFELNWQNNDIVHNDIFYSDYINFWRDCFPKPMHEALINAKPGEKFQYNLKSGEYIPKYSSGHIHKLRPIQFDASSKILKDNHPKNGRFYPKGLLRNMPGIYKQNMTPFRCLTADKDCLTVDFNHPLSDINIDVKVTLLKVNGKSNERGGSCMDWIETITEGLGMQARAYGKPTDFFSDHPFARIDSKDDGVFYEKPRLVGHIDRQASQVVSGIYEKVLKPDMKVLDLMSSWQSHMPKGLKVRQLTGLGMNAVEMEKNPALNEYFVHDLNINPKLPFENEIFDAVICTVSVEYLTKPFEVYREILRVLKPEGCLVVTFSNRWFPPKVISIWKELHEFERIGLVLEYFLQSKGFTDIHTQSVRGMPRPEDDEYAREVIYSDPVYAVWGSKKI
ncbi:MAG: methyltransferase domain-containing protein [Pseudomonadota bacterium]